MNCLTPSRPVYVVVTPARNEEENLPHTIRSMVAQTVRPLVWVIVDDGSNDRTAEILEEATQLHPWIVVRHRADRGFRKQGGGVIDTFYEGLELVPTPDWDFLVKFDADLSFERDFFERCFENFTLDPNLGIGGGVISHEVDGRLEPESPRDPAFHVRGATKIYRRQCWSEIGGLIRAPGWDTIDELKANQLGWRTRTFPDIKLRHHRFCGSADGVWKNQVKFGLSNYITGYHPLFMAAKCFKRCKERPFLIGAFGLAWGFCRGYIKRHERVNDPELIRYIRQQQINKLTLRPSLW